MSELPFWAWPLLLFLVCFVMGVIAVPAGIGGGTLFVPLVGGFFPFHLDFVRGVGLMVALASALAVVWGKGVYIITYSRGGPCVHAAHSPASAAFRYDPYSPAMDADPFPAYRTLRDEYPCFWSEEAGKWVLSRYHDILNALQDWRTYSSAQGNLVDEFPGRAGSTLGSSDPPRHDRLRALIQSAVTKRALDHILEPARASCRAHLAALDGRKEFDLVNDYAAKVTVDLLFHLFALPDENADLVRRNAVLMVQTDPVTRKKGEEHLAAFRWMADYAQNLAQERKRNPGEDLLSNFITAEIDGVRAGNVIAFGIDGYKGKETVIVVAEVKPKIGRAHV